MEHYLASRLRVQRRPASHLSAGRYNCEVVAMRTRTISDMIDVPHSDRIAP
jgi:hypothetical protein